MAESVLVSLTSEEHAALAAAAEAKGTSVESLAREAVLHVIKASSTKQFRAVRSEELNRIFDEMAMLIPPGTASLSDEALSRNGIYTREDDWNLDRR